MTTHLNKYVVVPMLVPRPSGQRGVYRSQIAAVTSASVDDAVNGADRYPFNLREKVSKLGDPAVIVSAVIRRPLSAEAATSY